MAFILLLCLSPISIKTEYICAPDTDCYIYCSALLSNLPNCLGQIDATQATSLTLICDYYRSCHHTIIRTPLNENNNSIDTITNVTCSGHRACEDATFEYSGLRLSNHQINIDCNTHNDSCSGADVSAYYAGNINFNCDGNSCTWVTMQVPKVANLRMTCTHGACFGLRVHAENASSVNLRCSGQQSCNQQTIWANNAKSLSIFSNQSNLIFGDYFGNFVTDEYTITCIGANKRYNLGCHASFFLPTLNLKNIFTLHCYGFGCYETRLYSSNGFAMFESLPHNNFIFNGCNQCVFVTDQHITEAVELNNICISIDIEVYGAMTCREYIPNNQSSCDDSVIFSIINDVFTIDTSDANCPYNPDKIDCGTANDCDINCEDLSVSGVWCADNIIDATQVEFGLTVHCFNHTCYNNYYTSTDIYTIAEPTNIICYERDSCQNLNIYYINEIQNSLSDITFNCTSTVSDGSEWGGSCSHITLYAHNADMVTINCLYLCVNIKILADYANKILINCDSSSRSYDGNVCRDITVYALEVSRNDISLTCVGSDSCRQIRIFAMDGNITTWIHNSSENPQKTFGVLFYVLTVVAVLIFLGLLGCVLWKLKCSKNENLKSVNFEIKMSAIEKEPELQSITTYENKENEQTSTKGAPFEEYKNEGPSAPVNDIENDEKNMDKNMETAGMLFKEYENIAPSVPENDENENENIIVAPGIGIGNEEILNKNENKVTNFTANGEEGKEGNISEGIDDKYVEIREWFDNEVKLNDNQEYYHKFIENGFDSLRIIKKMTENDLIQIGINKLGHRKEIIAQINLYKDSL